MAATDPRQPLDAAQRGIAPVSSETKRRVRLADGQRKGFETAWNEYFDCYATTTYLAAPFIRLEDISYHLYLKKNINPTNPRWELPSFRQLKKILGLSQDKIQGIEARLAVAGLLLKESGKGKGAKGENVANDYLLYEPLELPDFLLAIDAGRFPTTLNDKGQRKLADLRERFCAEGSGQAAGGGRQAVDNGQSAGGRRQSVDGGLEMAAVGDQRSAAVGSSHSVNGSTEMVALGTRHSALENPQSTFSGSEGSAPVAEDGTSPTTPPPTHQARSQSNAKDTAASRWATAPTPPPPTPTNTPHPIAPAPREQGALNTLAAAAVPAPSPLTPHALRLTPPPSRLTTHDSRLTPPVPPPGTPLTAPAPVPFPGTPPTPEGGTAVAPLTGTQNTRPLTHRSQQTEQQQPAPPSTPATTVQPAGNVKGNSVVVAPEQQLLIERGITATVAARLRQTVAPEAIVRQVDIYDHLREQHPDDPNLTPGRLRRQIEQDWAPPAGFVTAAERAARDTAATRSAAARQTQAHLAANQAATDGATRQTTLAALGLAGPDQARWARIVQATPPLPPPFRAALFHAPRGNEAAAVIFEDPQALARATGPAHASSRARIAARVADLCGRPGTAVHYLLYADLLRLLQSDPTSPPA